ncbi:hypothetical protein NJO91_00630 [Streptomyces microflavus]|uniref:hypothetical protein n=1 Tax=Streptomyces microflavus TaxID=1919 RepID=UPI0029B84C82|nr:hypothetical protein [Streptomyces microflavus]MDX2401625.1 hypothetical protein [Streptomyces microflavus]
MPEARFHPGPPETETRFHPGPPETEAWFRPGPPETEAWFRPGPSWPMMLPGAIAPAGHRQSTGLPWKGY